MNTEDSPIVIAKWRERFIAWIIDIAIFFTGIAIVYFLDFFYGWNPNPMWEIVPCLGFSVYLVLFEWKKGQTIGKKVMNIKITNLDGTKPKLDKIIISNIGKTFLLPIDVVLGWILTNDKKQRIFNKISDTIIIKSNTTENMDINYKFD
ncbi:hypothetical protein YTPLAS73_08280 [Nitrosarchaeum sp.]|nr:hypothetical protein YTPLAS73_08280 [Nitrosarchaeum sp.]